MLWWRLAFLAGASPALFVVAACARPDPAGGQIRIDRAVSRVADELERRPGLQCARDHDTPGAGETRNFFCGWKAGGGEVAGVGVGSDRATQRHSPDWVERQPFTQASAGRDYSITMQTADGLFDVKVFQRLPVGTARSNLPSVEQIAKQVLSTYDDDRGG